MLCPKCGTENTDQAEFCINCHERLSNEPEIGQSETKVPDTAKIDEKIADRFPDNKKPEVSLAFNMAIIIATIIFPIIGIAMGYTYIRKDHPDAKKAGRNWLVLGVVMFLVTILLVNSTK